MTRDKAIDRASRCFVSGDFKEMMARRIAIPTESQNPERAQDLMRYLTDEMVPDFRSMGFSTESVTN